MENNILENIMGFYLHSRDFNDCPLRSLREATELPESTIANHLRQLLKDNKINIINFPDGKRFHFIDTYGYELAVWSE